MSGQIPISEEFLPLLDAACDGALAGTQFQELAAWLDSDSTARKAFIEHVRLRTNIRFLRRAERSRDLAFARIETTFQSQPPIPPFPPISILSNANFGTTGYFSSGWPAAYLIATVIFGVGALIGTFTYVSQPVQVARESATIHYPRSTIHSSMVGRITGMADCKWADESTSAINGAYVSLGRKYALAAGLMEITYDTGAKVILQGPVTYEVDAKDGGYLSLGKLTARLETKAEGGGRRAEEVASGQWLVASKSEIRNQKSEIPNPSLSTIHYPLFTIKTPTATVTDLGTEFAVEVDNRGATVSHVFQGSVRFAVASEKGGGVDAATVLSAGESARTDVQGNRLAIVSPSGVKPSDFVREIPRRRIKTFDLVDVMAGEDGFNPNRDRWIDPTTGQVAKTMPKLPKTTDDYLVGDGQYHRVESLPMVDGVFIPDGGRGPVQVDSAGHVFAEFPVTSNWTSDHVWARGASPAEQTWAEGGRMGGLDYSGCNHSMIFLQANLAVTFDLDAVRQANPGCRLLRFRAAAGAPISGNGMIESNIVDFWVLIDGQVRFKRCAITSRDGVFSVVVPIGENERFLTLASTDGGNDISGDWILFGDPRLDLVSSSPPEGSAPLVK